jgi:hypothetical protein
LIEYLNALPPWPGVSHKATAEVMTAISKSGAPPGSTLADPFASSCSVAMSAKALGYRVLVNAGSVICEATAEAMIANRNRRLSPEERDLALTGAYGEVPIRKSKTLGLLKSGRITLGKVLAAEQAAESEPLRILYRGWLVKCLLTMAWWDMPNTDVDSADLDELTVAQAAKVGQLGRPLRLAMLLADQMNAGIFDNGYENTVARLPAPEFLSSVECHAAFLDPPHLGSQDRNSVYMGLSELLAPDEQVDTSRRTKAGDWAMLTEALDAAKHVPLLVLTTDSGADREAMVGAVEDRGREASLWSLRYHRAMTKKEVRDEADHEVLLIAPKPNKRRP